MPTRSSDSLISTLKSRVCKSATRARMREDRGDQSLVRSCCANIRTTRIFLLMRGKHSTPRCSDGRAGLLSEFSGATYPPRITVCLVRIVGSSACAQTFFDSTGSMVQHQGYLPREPERSLVFRPPLISDPCCIGHSGLILSEESSYMYQQHTPEGFGIIKLLPRPKSPVVLPRCTMCPDSSFGAELR